MGRVRVLEEELKSTGSWVFGGRLHEPGTATVGRTSDCEVLTTDGPFAESREHLGGFYVIEAEDLDAALAGRRGSAESSTRRSRSARFGTNLGPDGMPRTVGAPRPGAPDAGRVFREESGLGSLR